MCVQKLAHCYIMVTFGNYGLGAVTMAPLARWWLWKSVGSIPVTVIMLFHDDLSVKLLGNS